MPAEELTLRPAYGELELVRALMREYTDSLGVDLSFQRLEEELAALPGDYALPKGRLYLALWHGEAAGCAALRPLDAGRCEFKRLYVRPAYRRLGVGRRLAQALLADAGRIGYRFVCLDTLAVLGSAIRLYESMGFCPIPPYYDNPIEGVVYLGREV